MASIGGDFWVDFRNAIVSRGAAETAIYKKAEAFFAERPYGEYIVGRIYFTHYSSNRIAGSLWVESGSLQDMTGPWSISCSDDAPDPEDEGIYARSYHCLVEEQPDESGGSGGSGCSCDPTGSSGSDDYFYGDSGSFDVDVGGEGAAKDIVESFRYCIDHDTTLSSPEQSYFNASSLRFARLDEHGNEIWEEVNDECKGGLLIEAVCPEEEMDPSEATERKHIAFVECENGCENGRCLEGGIIYCTDPKAYVRYPGGSVWMADDGKVHISYCDEEYGLDSVVWLYCNDDGVRHLDVTPCEIDDDCDWSDPDCGREWLCGDGMCGGYTCEDTEVVADEHNRGGLKLERRFSMSGEIAVEQRAIMDDCGFNYVNREEAASNYSCPLKTSTDFHLLRDEIRLNFNEELLCSGAEYCDRGVCTEEEQIEELCVRDSDPSPDPHNPTGGDPTVLGMLSLLDCSSGPDNCVMLSPINADYCYYSLLPDYEGGVTVTGGGVVIQRDCDDAGNVLPAIRTDCPPDTPFCEDGVCVEKDPLCDCEITCDDSDNYLGGMGDLMTSGFVRLLADGVSVGYGLGDRCEFLGPDEIATRVWEGWCNGDEVMYTLETCPPEKPYCVNDPSGRCKNCEDTDVANDAYVRGTVLTILDEEVSDFCNHDDELVQISCKGGLIEWGVPEPCLDDEFCSNGICQSID